ncbi:hypothetical protein HK405_010887, partial [Cladochytrium tenue]
MAGLQPLADRVRRLALPAAQRRPPLPWEQKQEHDTAVSTAPAAGAAAFAAPSARTPPAPGPALVDSVADAAGTDEAAAAARLHSSLDAAWLWSLSESEPTAAAAAAVVPAVHAPPPASFAFRLFGGAGLEPVALTTPDDDHRAGAGLERGLPLHAAEYDSKEEDALAARARSVAVDGARILEEAAVKKKHHTRTRLAVGAVPLPATFTDDMDVNSMEAGIDGGGLTRPTNFQRRVAKTQTRPNARARRRRMLKRLQASSGSNEPIPPPPPPPMPRQRKERQPTKRQGSAAPRSLPWIWAATLALQQQSNATAVHAPPAADPAATTKPSRRQPPPPPPTPPGLQLDRLAVPDTWARQQRLLHAAWLGPQRSVRAAAAPPQSPSPSAQAATQTKRRPNFDPRPLIRARARAREQAARRAAASRGR